MSNQLDGTYQRGKKFFDNLIESWRLFETPDCVQQSSITTAFVPILSYNNWYASKSGSGLHQVQKESRKKMAETGMFEADCNNKNFTTKISYQHSKCPRKSQTRNSGKIPRNDQQFSWRGNSQAILIKHLKWKFPLIRAFAIVMVLVFSENCDFSPLIICHKCIHPWLSSNKRNSLKWNCEWRLSFS